ncbi:hypothetical protein ACIP5N_22285 [Streptomyces sp. NPDC088768]|uniref:hypothetical protein n=1 Tax=Streptomyces sp. NPDC088768 TaxID=3365894 RepID=UPI003805AEEF
MDLSTALYDAQEDTGRREVPGNEPLGFDEILVPREVLNGAVQHLAFCAGQVAADTPAQAQDLMGLTSALLDAQEAQDAASA